MKRLKKPLEIYICVGAGGVGKTTVSCILGLHFAKKGERTLIITVDPARRLLDVLSLKEESSYPQKVDLASILGGESESIGELHAFMPDLKKEWMDFLKACIKRSEIRHEISSNHFYKYMADGLPGSFEIICSHVLFRLMAKGKYDKIILDTPPSSHGISFFDVPKKISAVLNQSIFQALLKRRNSIILKFTKKFALFSGGILEKTLERLIGSHFLSELIDFALTIDALYEPMLKRTQAMEELLKDKATKYVLVARPSSASFDDSFYLQDALSRRGIAIDQIIVNQITPILNQQKLDQEIEILPDYLGETPQADVLNRLLTMHKNEVMLENKLIAKLKMKFKQSKVHQLYLCDASLDRACMLSRLLKDYQKAAI